VTLIVEALRAGYGQLEVLQSVGVRVDADEIVGVIGPISESAAPVNGD
jgi:ABC-type branched-subunit amino acid transport system ATPase component